MNDFYRTHGGRRFVDGTMPDLVRHIERCTTAIERLAAAAERVAQALEKGFATPDAK